MRVEMAFRRVAAALVCAAVLWAGPAARNAKPLNIVALGDSLTAGYGLPNQGFVSRSTRRRARAQGVAVHHVSNAGVSGDTASGGLARLDWSVPPDRRRDPRTRRQRRSPGIDPAVTRRALEAILAALAKRNIPVLLCGMLAPRNLGADLPHVPVRVSGAHQGSTGPCSIRSPSVASRLPQGLKELADGIRPIAAKAGRDCRQNPAQGR